VSARTAQSIEFFHLAFLQVLQSRLGKTPYVLKGGTNLRYFFHSHRYSEDMDLDVSEIEVWQLHDVVDGILGSKPLATLLRPGGLAVEATNPIKQSETTQRWKVGLSQSGESTLLRTKIAFSRRDDDDRYVLETVPRPIVEPHALRAPSVRHYVARPAVEQKVLALDERSETQARDVFDLDLLLRLDGTLADEVAEGVRSRAAEHAAELPYSAFRDQISPFLDQDVAELYDHTAWEQIKGNVIEKLSDGK
jgi:hypothetical protein